MPGPHAVFPPQLCVNTGKDRPEGENSVVALQIETLHRVGLAQRSMMCVVEQQYKTCSATPQMREAIYSGRIVPFVHNDEIGPVRQRVEIRLSGIVFDALEIGVRVGESVKRGRTGIVD